MKRLLTFAAALFMSASLSSCGNPPAAQEPVDETSYYLMGDFNGWNQNDERYLLTRITNYQYRSNEIELEIGKQVAVVSSLGLIYKNNDNYYRCPTGGTYVFTFNPRALDGKHLDATIQVPAGRIEYETTARIMSATGNDIRELSNVSSYALMPNGGQFGLNFANHPSITMNALTPGDKAKFEIKIFNHSNINSKVLITPVRQVRQAPSLFDVLSITYHAYDKDNHDVTDSFLSWMEFNAVDNPVAGQLVFTLEVEIELPLETGNQYANSQASIMYNVEAVQANAAV